MSRRWIGRMAQLHLPAEHDAHDLVVAGTLARVLGSRELFVAWSATAGSARPVVPAELPEPPRRRRGGLLGRRPRR